MVTILVVDDDIRLRRDICEILQLEGYTTRDAVNGKQAIYEILDNHPDLILYDVHMPEMNGYELLQQLQAEPELASIPFVFVIALTPDALQKSMDYGAKAFVSKPFSTDTLLTTIHNLLTGTCSGG